MPYKAHRHGDSRICGATTVVQNQSSVYVNGKLWAVLATENSHGNGGLINSTGTTIEIENKPVIVHGPDVANPDDLCPVGSPHCNPETAEGSDDVQAY